MPFPGIMCMTGRLRVAHGISALAILLFVAFHLTNHLFGLFGPIMHAQVMAMGRVVYRSRFVEPVFVAILLFQVASGAKLAWRCSARPLDAAGVLQVGSGAYLAAFILTHLNSAFVSARWVHNIPTDWAWATGAPDGLLMDAWNIRLLPHYALGVFFVIAHVFCGLRTVLLAHARPLALAVRESPAAGSRTKPATRRHKRRLRGRVGHLRSRPRPAPRRSARCAALG